MAQWTGNEDEDLQRFINYSLDSSYAARQYDYVTKTLNQVRLQTALFAGPNEDKAPDGSYAFSLGVRCGEEVLIRKDHYEKIEPCFRHLVTIIARYEVDTAWQDAHVMAINDVDNPAHFNFDLSGHHPYIRGIDMRTSEPYPLAWSGDFFNPTVVICRGEIVCAVVFFVACKDELVCGAIFHPLSPGRWRQGIASVGYSNTRGTYGMIQMGRFHVGAGMENSLTDCIELLKHKFNDSKPSIDSLDLCTDGRFAAGLVDAIIGLE